MTQNEYPVTIPEIEIARDWYVSDLKTIGECDDALDYLTEAIASIEGQLMQPEADRGPGWRAATSKSLRFKKRAFESVTRVRAFLASKEKRAFAWLRDNDLPAYSRAIAAIEAADGEAG